MLNRLSNMKLSKDLYIEWIQCRDEGLDVDKYEQLFKNLGSFLDGDDYLAQKLVDILHHKPMRADFPYVEPCDYAGIVSESPKNISCDFSKIPEGKSYLEKLTSAWTGRIVGCLLGKPVEGLRREALYPLMKESGNYPLHKYFSVDDFPDAIKERLAINERRAWINNISGNAPIDDDTNYTALSLLLMKKHGFDITSEQIVEGWLSYLPYLTTYTAERVAYRNAARAIAPPMSAILGNPHREWIGAQIRVDLYGYVYPGDPVRAAELAYRDAVVSHTKNGIYSAMAIAAMIAAAFATQDIITIIKAGLSVIPQRCRLRDEIDAVVDLWEKGATEEAAIDFVHSKYDEHVLHHWCHGISNTMIVVLSLLYGKGDFSKSICLSVQAGFDTDCNAATVGSIVGAMVGIEGIDPIWTDPVGGKLATAILGMNMVTIDYLVEETLKLTLSKVPDKSVEDVDHLNVSYSQ